MNPETKSSTDHGQAWVNALGDLPGAIRLQTETWLKEQTGFTDGMQELMTGRVARCQNGAEATFRTFERICRSQDGADALVAYNEWLVGNIGFFMADVTALQEQAARMTQMGQRTLRALAGD